jgi:ABC-type glycerol-3-phosphate transport system permease component
MTTTTTIAEPATGHNQILRFGSSSRRRRRTLYWSYFFLTLFVIFFLIPPIYMFITSLKWSAEISAATNPWWMYHPTLSNYVDLLTRKTYLIFFLLINHWWMILIVLLPTLTVPFCTWIMIGYFASIPKELDEAALIDGAGYIQMLTKIFIPVAIPGIIAATIFCSTVSWANFLYGLAFTTSADQLTLAVGIVTTLIRGDVYAWGQIMTGALLGAAPPLII